MKIENDQSPIGSMNKSAPHCQIPQSTLPPGRRNSLRQWRTPPLTLLTTRECRARPAHGTGGKAPGKGALRSSRTNITYSKSLGIKIKKTIPLPITYRRSAKPLRRKRTNSVCKHFKSPASLQHLLNSMKSA